VDLNQSEWNYRGIALDLQQSEWNYRGIAPDLPFFNSIQYFQVELD